MARITLKELVVLMKQAPDYHEKWEMEVPAEQALYIRFGPNEQRGLKSEVLEVVGGLELVVDRDESGKVVGIELV